MSNAQMEFLLSSITQFDEMKGKRFEAKKCENISPRIVALQRSLGFAPGEPINAKNIRRIIPATENINLILKRKKQIRTPPQKIQPGKACTPQNRFGIGARFLPGSSHTPTTANGGNSRYSTPATSKSSVKKVSNQHDVVGTILKRSLSIDLSSRFYTPNAAKSSAAKDKTESSKNSDGEATSSQESGVSVSTVHTEICEDKENEIPDLEF